MGVRCSAEVTQAIIPPLLESVDALVTRLSTDFEPAAQLRDGLFPLDHISMNILCSDSALDSFHGIT